MPTPVHAPTPSSLKDHEIATFVNELTRIAKTYGQTQQLRANLAREVHRVLRPNNGASLPTLQKQSIEQV